MKYRPTAGDLVYLDDDRRTLYVVQEVIGLVVKMQTERDPALTRYVVVRRVSQYR